MEEGVADKERRRNNTTKFLGLWLLPFIKKINSVRYKVTFVIALLLSINKKACWGK